MALRYMTLIYGLLNGHCLLKRPDITTTLRRTVTGIKVENSFVFNPTKTNFILALREKAKGSVSKALALVK